MQTLSKIREGILELLKSDIRFDGTKLLGEFSGGQRNLPVKETTIAVGLERVELSAAGLGGYVGEAAGLSHGLQAFHAPLAEITLRFDCWRPQTEEFGNIFVESIYECLLPVTGLSKIWCEAIRPEPGALANHLRIFATVRVLLARESDTESRHYDGIILKRRS